MPSSASRRLSYWETADWARCSSSPAFVKEPCRATKAGVEATPMVNWEVVGKNVDALTAMVKRSWAKLTS